MRQIAILAPLLLLLAGVPLRAQAVASAAADIQRPADPHAAPFAFDVASIKPSDPNSRGGISGFDATGLRVSNYPLLMIVYMAYFPSNSNGHEFVGMPPWARERYDLIAHVDEASAPAWLKLAPLQRQLPGRLMLQQLLADRCKLVAHTVPSQVNGYVLVVGKGGSHLTPSKPNATYPPDAKNWDGAKVVTAAAADNTHVESYFNATVEQLAERLGANWIIQDQTHLTGRYDFTIRRVQPLDADGKRISDPLPNDVWDISGTGLEIKPAKLPSENLVIDHIERPSPN